MRKIILLFFIIGALSSCHYDKAFVDMPNIPKDTLKISYSPSSSTIIVGTAGSSVSPIIKNTVGGIVTFKISIPTTGFSLDNNGVISWANTVPKGTYNLGIVATNIKGMVDSTRYTLYVNASGAATAPSAFVYSPASSSVNQGTAGSSLAPSINTGGAAVTYSLTSTQSGITINLTSGVISWSNTMSPGNYTITAKATNSAGSATTTYSLTVVYLVRFSLDILPVISNQCATCHHGSHTTWTQWSTINNESAAIYSRLKPTGNMPQGSSLSPVPTTQVSSGLFRDLFQLWITQGKLNN
jgi:hypothetical protein